MLNNSLFYSKNLNADPQNKWCCFDLMLPGKSYWQAEYLQHLTALAWRWWYGRSFCPTTLDSLQSPNNVEMIQSCWIYFVTVCMVTKCCCVSFRQLDDGLSGNEEAVLMETKTWDGNKLKNIWILRHFQHFNDHICSTLPNLLVWPNINLAQQCAYNLVHSASQLSTVYTVPTQAGDLCGEFLYFDIDNFVKWYCSFTLE